MINDKRVKIENYIFYTLLIFLTIVFIFPILLVLMNSFKSRLYVSTQPFAEPTEKVPQMNKFTNTTRIIRI